MVPFSKATEKTYEKYQMWLKKHFESIVFYAIAALVSSMEAHLKLKKIEFSSYLRFHWVGIFLYFTEMEFYDLIMSYFK